MENDRTYFVRRATEEQSAAEHAAHPKAREAHSALADRYRTMADSCEEERPPAEPPAKGGNSPFGKTD